MTRCRPSESADLTAIAAWIGSAADCRLWCGSRVTYPIDLEALAGALEFAESESWTIAAGDRVLAFGQLVPKPHGRIHLARLISAPDRRREGLGREIAAHLLDRSLARGASAISLNVFRENGPAFALYAALGFAPAPRPSDEAESESIYMEYASR